MLCLIIAVVVALPYAVTSSPLYCRHSQIGWDPVDCYKFALQGQTARIVFVGDSSLADAVRPNQIARVLHVTSLNLGEPAGIMAFAPYALLDHYLRHNARPRLVVLYVDPWTTLDSSHHMDRLWYDAARFEVRHASAGALLRFFATDPRRLLRYPALAIAQGFRQVSLSGIWWKQATAEMAAEHGFLAVWRPGRVDQESIRQGGKPPNLLTDDCHLALRPVAPSRTAIAAFRHHYQRDGTRVLVYVAPIPRCDPSFPTVVGAWSEIADNAPATLPSHLFVDDGWRAHLVLAGARRATGLVINFLRREPSAKPNHDAKFLAGASAGGLPR